MLPVLVAATAFFAIARPAEGFGILPIPGKVANQFIVKYNILPDPLGLKSFYNMPRTVGDAIKDKFRNVDTRFDDNTEVWCRKKDHRVCVLFDQRGGVAGIQISVKVSELENKTPLTLENIPEWRRDRLVNQDVYALNVFFVSKDILLSGGRNVRSDTLTAPDGIYILQTDKNGTETGRLHVLNEEAAALQSGFTEQECFVGMGKHYFQELTRNSTCENHRPFFLLFGPKSKKLTGFGFTQYGKVSPGRGWFETPPALVAKIIAPESPQCQTDWINTHGLFSTHVYFVEKPWFTTCCK